MKHLVMVCVLGILCAYGACASSDLSADERGLVSGGCPSAVQCCATFPCNATPCEMYAENQCIYGWHEYEGEPRYGIALCTSSDTGIICPSTDCNPATEDCCEKCTRSIPGGAGTCGKAIDGPYTCWAGVCTGGILTENDCFKWGMCTSPAY